MGALFVKELAWLDKSAGIPVATLKLRSIPTLPAGDRQIFPVTQIGAEHRLTSPRPGDIGAAPFKFSSTTPLSMDTVGVH